MNYWFWLILLWSAFGRNGGCGCGNGGGRGNGCGNGGGRGRDCDSDIPRRTSFTSPVSSNCGCGCDDEMMTSRGFAGFGDGGTCGCEEKIENHECKKD